MPIPRIRTSSAPMTAPPGLTLTAGTLTATGRLRGRTLVPAPSEPDPAGADAGATGAGDAELPGAVADAAVWSGAIVAPTTGAWSGGGMTD